MIMVVSLSGASTDQLLKAFTAETSADELFLAQRMNLPVVSFAVGASTCFDKTLVQTEIVAHTVAPRFVHILEEVLLLVLHVVCLLYTSPSPRDS